MEREIVVYFFEIICFFEIVSKISDFFLNIGYIFVVKFENF